ncbi:unnamed protein product [Urochloa decumbens]|uniref:RBR-type E3 ubiquitin transferase n=1 Tax=Urochloa decumbens TaxID=240449 RepID=A0ABC9C5E7_9POAL
MENAHGGEREPSPEEESESREGRLLREMMLRARREAEEEPQVPDEQLHANDQLQRDEMLALEAIYGDNISIFGEEFGMRSFQIHVHCEIPDGISVSAELFQGVDDSRLFHSFSVQHLAPISLTFLMPLSYPSRHPPYFTLTVQWLDPVKVSSLCHMLDLIWAQQPGQEVVYEWVQWLQSSALSHLGFDDEIAIHHSDSVEQCHELFLSGLHNCMICLSEYTGVDFIKLPCQHYFCRRCMETYSRMHVKEGTVLKLLCPDDKCQSDVPPNLMQRLLGDADFERWERLILQKTLDSMADAAYCPRSETICLEDEEKNAQCSKCFFSFCTLCRLHRHIGERCVGITPEEKLLSLQERQKVRRLSKGDLEKTISLAKEIFSIKEVLHLCVQCPYCDIGISRVSGCNHMVCGNCGWSFCYGCGVAGCLGCDSSKARNDPEKVQKLDATRFLTAQTDASTERRKEPTIIRSRQYPCPSCHQPNSKVGNNNHIFCWACQVHYCALCRKVVRKYAEHYGPRGCKQHSVNP